ncbi:MAG: thiamine phosphate synthase [Pseudomonadota bacterium]
MTSIDITMTNPCQLYLITPPKISLETFPAALEAALSAAAEAPIACLQLRLKGASDEDILQAAAVLKPICASQGVALLINDRADLAKKAKADGVHLGQGDGSVAEARALLGAEANIGVTCHDSRHLAMEAGEAGADYVAFGAFYPTSTKETTHRPEPEILTAWSQMTTVPCVAIGGITPENAGPLVRAGADYLAVSAAIWTHASGPAAAVKAFAPVLREEADIS